jgi:guanylate kinase
VSAYKNKIFIISGPSGSGQDSAIEELKKMIPIERVITNTTRKMRPREAQGQPYYFISKAEFKKGIKEGKFFEYAQQYNNEFYGVTNDEIERVKAIDKLGIWKLDYKGVLNAKKLMPEVKSILIIAPLEILEQRIRARGQVSDEYVEDRMKYTREWIKHEDDYDFKVINEQGKLDATVSQILEIIKNN